MPDPADITTGGVPEGRGPIRRDHVTVHRRPLAGGGGGRNAPDGGQARVSSESQDSARAKAPINQRWKAALGAVGTVAGTIALTVLIRRIPGGRLFR